MKNQEKSPFSYFFTLGFVLFFHAFLLVAVVLETLKREKFARLSSRVLCYFLSLSSFFTKPASQPPQNTRKDGKKADTLETVDDGARLGLR